MSEKRAVNDIQIKRITVTTDRPEHKGTFFDIEKSVIELNIFESVEIPFLTAQILMTDDVAFRHAVGIKGDERCQIELVSPQSESHVVIKNFIITGMAKEQSNNERVDIRVLTLIEEHGYLNYLKKISKTYSGLPLQILSDVFANDLGRRATLQPNDGIGVARPVQQPMKYIAPYINALDVVERIRDRISTRAGSPYFCYSNLRSDDIFIQDLETIYKEDPWNKDHPYTFGMAAANMEPGIDEHKKYFHIKNFTAGKIESVFRMAQAGAYGASYNVMDLTSATQLSDNQAFHDGSRTLQMLAEELNTVSVMSPEDSLQIGPAESKVKSINQYESKSFTSIVASQLFYQNESPLSAPMNGYHDENQNSAMYRLKIKSAALRAIITNNIYNITVPGMPYLINQNAGVGTTIMVKHAIPSMAIGDGNGGDKARIDKKRSGKFMIYKARHQFTIEGDMNTSMEIVKLMDDA